MASPNRQEGTELKVQHENQDGNTSNADTMSGRNIPNVAEATGNIVEPRYALRSWKLQLASELMHSFDNDMRMSQLLCMQLMEKNLSCGNRR